MLTIQELEALRGLVQINVNINLPKGHHHMAYDQVRLPFSWRPTTVTGLSVVEKIPLTVSDDEIGLTLGITDLILDQPAYGFINGISSPFTSVTGTTTKVRGMDFSGCASLSQFSLPRLTQVGNIALIGCAIVQGDVDALLVSLVSATEWSDGVTAWIGVVDISGGTNAIPSGTGLSAKTTLEGRGATVVVNS